MAKLSRPAATGRSWQRLTPSQKALLSKGSAVSVVRTGIGSAQASYATPFPPVLSLVYASGNPTLLATIASLRALDVIELQFGPVVLGVPDFSNPQRLRITIGSDLQTVAALIEAEMTTLANGDWAARMLQERTGLTPTDWSNVVQFTVSGAAPAASITSVILTTGSGNLPSFTASYINASPGDLIEGMLDESGGDFSTPVKSFSTNVVSSPGSASLGASAPAVADGSYISRFRIDGGAWVAGPAVTVSTSSGTAITGVSMTLDQPIVALKPVYPISIQPGAEVGDQVQLRIATGAGMTGTITFNQTITLTQPMITNMVIPFNIPAQTGGALLYAQAGVTRGAGAQVLSNIVNTQMPSGLLTRAPLISVGNFLASGTQTFDPLVISNTATGRRIFTIVGCRGDNDVRPVNVTIEGASATAHRTWIETTVDIAMKLFVNDDAATVSWDVTSQFQDGVPATVAAFRSWAIAIQAENCQATTGDHISSAIFGTTNQTLPSINIPAGAIGIAIAFRDNTQAPTWTGATQELFNDLIGANSLSVAKFTNSTGSTVSWAPQVTYSGTGNGQMLGFAILP